MRWEAEKDGGEGNRRCPETVSRRSVTSVGKVWHKILPSARRLTVDSSTPARRHADQPGSLRAIAVDHGETRGLVAGGYLFAWTKAGRSARGNGRQRVRDGTFVLVARAQRDRQMARRQANVAHTHSVHTAGQ